jgi:hypothetical protein
MFSFFRKKPLQQNHPLFGPLVYRANRNKNSQLPGFWEGKLNLGFDEPIKLVIWGDAEQHPHSQQSALFNRIVEELDHYVEESKRGLIQQIQAESEQAVYPERAIWQLDQLYFQAYPMSERLQADLPPELRKGVAWGLAFEVQGLLQEGETQQAFSALIDQQWHPRFPFTVS